MAVVPTATCSPEAAPHKLEGGLRAAAGHTAAGWRVARMCRRCSGHVSVAVIGGTVGRHGGRGPLLEGSHLGLSCMSNDWCRWLLQCSPDHSAHADPHRSAHAVQYAIPSNCSFQEGAMELSADEPPMDESVGAFMRRKFDEVSFVKLTAKLTGGECV